MGHMGEMALVHIFSPIVQGVDEECGLIMYQER